MALAHDLDRRFDTPSSGTRQRSTVARHLSDLLLGGTVRSARAAERIGANGGWHAALEQAERWRVLPTFRERLAGVDPVAVGLEREVAASLRAQSALSALRSAEVLRHAGTALRVLADAGVPAVAIKGVAAIATLYGASSRRMVGDVDVVIQPSDLVQARAAFAARSYIDRSPPFERHVSDIALSRALHNFARTYVRDNIEIDLHWQFGPRPPAGLCAERIVARATDVAVEGEWLRVAGPVEAALLLSHHALRSAFGASSTIKDLVDLGLWWQVHGDSWGDELAATARESNLGSSLLALSLALHARDSAHPAAAAIALLEQRLARSERTQARALLAFFEDGLRGAAPDEATVALFAPQLYTRSLWSVAWREVIWRVRGSVPPAAEIGNVRRPIITRVVRRLSRGWRIGRELGQLRRIGTYRAVARAQSRFH